MSPWKGVIEEPKWKFTRNSSFASWETDWINATIRNMTEEVNIIGKDTEDDDNELE